MTPTVILLGLVTAERLAELWLARRNTRNLLDRGAVEIAPGHYPMIVLFHAVWLLGLWIFGAGQPLITAWVAVFLGFQALRIWVLLTLGPRWTTRIIVLPNAPLVTSGPYRFFAHPNYLVVIGEIALLPLALGMPWYALAFSAANGLLLWVRITAESQALNTVRHAHLS
jgi:methyltransferase